MLKITIFLIFLSSIQCLNLCGDWIQYKDIKCIKVLEKKGTEEEALGNCTQLEQSSSLLTIHSKEEQEFFNNILVKYSNVSTFSWIGIKYLDKTYKWIDGSLNNYSNWAEDAVRDGKDECVQMSLISSILGKWSDENCMKTALIVCQKNQEINFTVLKNIIEKQENEINSIKANLFPIGFLYTQLPNTSTPQQLWPSFKWSEVTKDFAGLFLRAEGGGSLPFGQIQQEDNPRIVHVSSGSMCGIAHPKQKDIINTPIVKGVLSDNIARNAGDSCASYNFQILVSNVENKPINTAVKIWKRIG